MLPIAETASAFGYVVGGWRRHRRAALAVARLARRRRAGRPGSARRSGRRAAIDDLVYIVGAIVLALAAGLFWFGFTAHPESRQLVP